MSVSRAVRDQALQIYTESPARYERLMQQCTSAVEPTKEDARNPLLWKGIHWRWFFETDGGQS